MPPEESVLDQLNKDFPLEEEQRDEVFGDEIKKPEKEDEEVIPEDIKNRHIRRLEAKLAKERKANIELAARESARSEYAKFAEKTKDLTVDERLVALYGNDENGQRAAKLTQSLLEDAVKRAREETLSDVDSRQKAQAEETKKYGNLIEDQLEEIEEEYKVDLSGSDERSKQIRNSFLSLVNKLSPKDAEGNIEHYADFSSTWEIFQDRMQKSNARSKELSSRSMTRSGSQTEIKKESTVGEKWLREQGIL